MFTSLESFSAFFFVSFAVILLGIIFEDKLVALETKMYKKSHSKSRARNHAVNNNRPNSRKAAPLPEARVHRTKGTGFAA